MKLERLRSRATEKIMNRVAAARVRAAEMRAAMSARQAEQLTKSLDRGTANHHQNHQNHHQNQNQFLNIRSRGSNYFSESLGVCFPAILPWESELLHQIFCFVLFSDWFHWIINSSFIEMDLDDPDFNPKILQFNCEPNHHQRLGVENCVQYFGYGWAH